MVTGNTTVVYVGTYVSSLIQQLLCYFIVPRQTNQVYCKAACKY